MALAFCVQRMGLKARAFIVEHGLREESADEAQLVAKRLAAMGIEVEILPWTHDAVKSRVHVEARAARYGLLAQACAKYGLETLLIAHHKDDQAETILLRLAKGSGIEGLAGMAPVTMREGLRLARPFLSVAHARLVATCQAANVPFVMDPSNDSPKYARGRLRGVADVLSREGLTVDRLVDLGTRAGEAAAAILHYAMGLLRENARILPGGVLQVEAGAFASVPQAVGLKALSLCLLHIHPSLYDPERRPLLGVYQKLLDAGDEAVTLHGVEIRKSGAKVTFVRELQNCTDRQVLLSEQPCLWDGRWIVALPFETPSLREAPCVSKADEAIQGRCRTVLHDPGLLRCARNDEEELEIRALGVQPHALLDELAPGLRAKIPQGRARAALPAMWRGATLVAIPSFSEENQGQVTASLISPLWA